MRTKAVVIPVAALAIAFGSFSAEAAQRGERRSRGTQNQGQARPRADDSARPRGNQGDARASSSRGGSRSERTDRRNGSPDQERERASAQSRSRDARPNRDGDSAPRYGQRGPEAVPRGSREDDRGSRNTGRSGSYDSRRDYDPGRTADRGSYGGSRNGGYSRGYYAPRLLPRRSGSRHYYGSGGRLSLYFGIGSGYLYGSPYSGRVYGYRRYTPSYGGYQSYGDVRLKVSPRDAAVYVDGYYAGIVDDFDGFFQRLTIEVGPHEIEIEAPGLGSQVFDVYVDPSRTIDLHADLLR